MPRAPRHDFHESLYRARSIAKRWVLADPEYVNPATTEARRAEILLFVMENAEAEKHLTYRPRAPRPAATAAAAPVPPANAAPPTTATATATAAGGAAAGPAAPQPVRRSARIASQKKAS